MEREPKPSIIEVPAYSPDLNPIDNIWGVLKQRLSKRCFNNLKDLGTAILTEWQTFTPDFLRNFVYSIPKRLEMCIKSKGKKIKY